MVAKKRASRGLFIAILLIGLALLYTSNLRTPSGLTILQEQSGAQQLTLTASSTIEQPLSVEKEMESFLLSGSFDEQANFSIYLEQSNQSYLVIDSNSLLSAPAALLTNTTNNTTTYTFISRCQDSCNLPQISGNFTLYIQVHNGSVYLDGFSYNYLESMTNYPPVITNLDHVGLIHGTSITMNLSQYCTDNDSSAVYFLITSPDHASATLTSDTLNLSYYDHANVSEDQITLFCSDGVSTTEQDVKLSLLEPSENYAPIAKQDLTLLVQADTSVTIDLLQYFMDYEGEPLGFAVSNAKGISASLTGTQLSLSAASDFSGDTIIPITVKDSAHTLIFNFTVSVFTSKSNVPIIKDQKIRIRAGERATITQKIKVLEKTDKLVVNIDEEAITDVSAQRITEENTTLNITNVSVDTSSTAGLITGNAILEGSYDLITGFTTLEEGGSEVTIDVAVDTDEEIILEYTVGDITAYEQQTGELEKKVVIESPTSYEDIYLYTALPNVPSANVNIAWIVDADEYLIYTNTACEHETCKLQINEYASFGVTFYDDDQDGLSDGVEWIVPHLSNQTFEINITVFNTQSYPQVYGGWTIQFSTIGTENLTVSAINGTTYDESFIQENATTNDLQVMRLVCDGTTYFDITTNESAAGVFISTDEGLVAAEDAKGASLENLGIVVEDYSCNATGYFTVQVLTYGKHHQQLQFGSEIAYANNFASFFPIKDIVIFSSGNQEEVTTLN